MADLRLLKDRAADLAARGKLDGAADLYRDVLAQDPRDVSSRQKLAELLRRAGRINEAIPLFTDVADRFARDGHLLKAIAICKTILELDPAHVATQAVLADLYSRRGGPAPGPAARRGSPASSIAPVVACVAPEPTPSSVPPPVASVAEPNPTPVSIAPPVARAAPEPQPDERHGAVPPPAAAPAVPSTRASAAAALGEAATPLSEILSAVAAAAPASLEEELLVEVEPGPERELPGAQAPAPARASAPPSPFPALPRVPIFSDLSRDAFLALTREMVLHRAGPGAVVLHEGDPGASFFVVATGRLAVSKRDDRGEAVTLAHLGEGDFFGEMALLSGAPRAASVTAEEETELLELRADALLALAREHPEVAASLRRFYRQRLLANALAVSPVFRPFGRDDRKLLMAQFRARPVSAGETVIREGDPSDGLYVILDGAVDVLKRKGPETVVVGRLREGDLFGEMSCLRKSPAAATVVARRGGTLLRLPRAAFDALVAGYPQVLELVSELTEERAESLDAILSGHAEWTEDGLILI
jgi:CRP-like cAMP-binding protein